MTKKIIIIESFWENYHFLLHIGRKGPEWCLAQSAAIAQSDALVAAGLGRAGL